MGLFDGAADGTGATADIAALFGLPVVLVVDVTGMGASVAALIDGFRRHREDVEVVGVDPQPGRQPGACRAAEPRLLRACLDPGAGHASRATRRSRLPSRHLGLVQAAEHPDLGRLPRRRRPIWSRTGSTSTACSGSRARRACRCSAPTRAPGRRSASASRSRAIGPSPSPTRPCSTAGGARAPRCCPFSPLADEPPDRARGRRLPARRLSRAARRPARRATTASCRAARRRRARRLRLRRMRRLHGAGPRADRPRGPGSPDGRAPARGHQLRRAQAASRLSPDRAVEPQPARPRRRRTCAATSSTMRARSSASGAPLFHARCARGRDLGPQGCRQGHVAGSFLHLIDRASRRAPPRPAA